MINKYLNTNGILNEYNNFKNLTDKGEELLKVFKLFLKNREEILLVEDEVLKNEFSFYLMNHSFTSKIQSNVTDEHRFNTGNITIYINSLQDEFPVEICDLKFHINGLIEIPNFEDVYYDSFHLQFYSYFYTTLKEYLNSNNLYFNL